MSNKAKIIVVLLLATIGVMAFMCSSALAGVPDVQIGDPPVDGTIGDPPYEPPTVVNHKSTEGPCIDGFKLVTDYDEYSDGTAASSIAKVPCDPNTPPETQPQPDPTPVPVTPPVTATSLPRTGASLPILALAGTILMASGGAIRLALRKIK